MDGVVHCYQKKQILLDADKKELNRVVCDVILQIESRNNGLEMQSVNNKALMEELDKLLERLRIPQEVWCREE